MVVVYLGGAGQQQSHLAEFPGGQALLGNTINYLHTFPLVEVKLLFDKQDLPVMQCQPAWQFLVKLWFIVIWNHENQLNNLDSLTPQDL